MNKKIFSLLILASLNLAIPLFSMEKEEDPKKESVITNPSKEILQKVFNAHALRLAPPSPALVEIPSNSWFSSQKTLTLRSVSKTEKINCFYALQTILQEAHKIGVSLDILKVPVNKETDVWPIHEAAKKGHSLIGTVAHLYPEALSASSSQFKFICATPHSIIEEITKKNPQKSGYLKRLYQVHEALKKRGKFDEKNSSALWTSIIQKLVAHLNDEPEKESKKLALSEYNFPLLQALQHAHQLGIILGENLSEEQQKTIFTAAIKKENSALILAAKKHGMRPSEEVTKEATTQAMNPQKSLVAIATLAALLGDPAKIETANAQEEVTLFRIE